MKREREAQLAQAKENLARLTVSEEVVALRSESNRVLRQELLQGAALKSQAAIATAQEYDAKALLLQLQLNYSQAHDEFIHAMGLNPHDTLTSVQCLTFASRSWQYPQATARQ